MNGETLAVKYRPKTFDDVVEQDAIKTILTQQLKTNTFKHAYLFCGPAGDGKTTCARIFANEINHGQGNPIEMDAASNSSVDDVRDIIQQARTQSLDSEYKVFIVDECHSLSNTAWQAMLKLIEEPPAKSIFIFATTDPQKIPATILSRVQRYDFRRVSYDGIVSRLKYIIEAEPTDYSYELEALEYIAKLADGGMRDAITLLDKCLSYSNNLTLENVTTALGAINYSVIIDIVNYLIDLNSVNVISTIESVYQDGKDLKQFIKQIQSFIVDYEKYAIGCPELLLSIPATQECMNALESWYTLNKDSMIYDLLEDLIKLSERIKWSSSPKMEIEADLTLFCVRENEYYGSSTKVS